VRRTGREKSENDRSSTRRSERRSEVIDALLASSSRSCSTCLDDLFAEMISSICGCCCCVLALVVILLYCVVLPLGRKVLNLTVDMGNAVCHDKQSILCAGGGGGAVVAR